MAKPCGHVICKTCTDSLVRKAKQCIVCDTKVSEKELIEMKREGKGACWLYERCSSFATQARDLREVEWQRLTRRALHFRDRNSSLEPSPHIIATFQKRQLFCEGLGYYNRVADDSTFRVCTATLAGPSLLSLPPSVAQDVKMISNGS